MSRAAAAYQQQQQQTQQLPTPPDQQVHIRLPSEPTNANIGEIRLNQMQEEANANEKGELFLGRDPDVYGDNQFGDINGRGVVYGGNEDDIDESP